MDSSLMNKTESSTPLEPECHDLLVKCLNPKTHHDEIGKALQMLLKRQEELAHSAEYWLLLATATELFRPHGSPRHIRRYLNHAEACEDIDQFKAAYAQWRINALSSRVNRSSASINDSYKSAYDRRLTQARIDQRDMREDN